MVWISVQFLWRNIQNLWWEENKGSWRERVCRDLWSQYLTFFSKPFLVTTSLPTSSPKFWGFFLDSNIRIYLNYLNSKQLSSLPARHAELSVLYHISSGLTCVLIMSLRNFYPIILPLSMFWSCLSEHRDFIQNDTNIEFSSGKNFLTWILRQIFY